MTFVAAHDTVKTNTSDSVYNRLMSLHEAIHPRVRNHNLDLHPRWQKSSIVSQESAASPDDHNSWALTYFRSREQAEMVERLMGKDRVAINGNVETYRHPVIEFRYTPQHFAIELILSPYAWWDQQNFVGKLELPAHRETLRTLLRGLDPNYRFGFWHGSDLDDMHLTVGQLLRGRVLEEWVDTFAERLDWLRLGKWYDVEDPILETNHFYVEAFETVKSLHSLYTFILWTSNNNFHGFYEKRRRQVRRNMA
jgi:hypothetical protein